MATIAIPISEILLASLNQSVNEVAETMKRQYALKMFREAKLTLNQGAEFCGLNMYEFMALLDETGIPIIDYDDDDFDREMANLEAYKPCSL
jgi:predicted HTH domain antitoxin